MFKKDKTSSHPQMHQFSQSGSTTMWAYAHEAYLRATAALNVELHIEWVLDVIHSKYRLFACDKDQTPMAAYPYTYCPFWLCDYLPQWLT